MNDRLYYGILSPRQARDDSRLRSELQKTFTEHDLVSDQLVLDPVGNFASSIRNNHPDLLELEKELWGLVKEASQNENPCKTRVIFDIFGFSSTLENIMLHQSDFSIYDELIDPYMLSFCIPLKYQHTLINDFQTSTVNSGSAASSATTEFWATLIHLLDVRTSKYGIGAFQLGVTPKLEQLIKSTPYTKILKFLSNYPLKFELRFSEECLGNLLVSEAGSRRRKDLLEMKYLQIISGGTLDAENVKNKMPFLNNHHT